MASCYWQRCNCPDQQACLEHTGFFCGLWNGTRITDYRQVVDTVTRDAELSLARSRRG